MWHFERGVRGGILYAFRGSAFAQNPFESSSKSLFLRPEGSPNESVDIAKVPERALAALERSLAALPQLPNIPPLRLINPRFQRYCTLTKNPLLNRYEY